MCQDGASLVQEKAISQISSERLAVFILWTPRYPGDSRAKAVAATQFVSDSRAKHYWDAAGTLPRMYGSALGLPADDQFAWDTYMVFNADAEWNPPPPQPTDWMHQMSRALGPKHPRWLNGDRFRESVQALIDQQ